MTDSSDQKPPANGEPKRIVETGYNRIAERYLASRDALTPSVEGRLERMLRNSPAGASVLDLGCGAGVPVSQWLAERRPVTGVDISAKQLELAGRLVPDATFIRADMTTVDFPEASFGSAAALYSIIHVPRAEQPELLRRIYRWLAPNGTFLATWAITAWEGEERDWFGWGAPMWWSHFDQQTSLALLRQAGFVIEVAEPTENADERWLWVLARKPYTEPSRIVGSFAGDGRTKLH